MEVGEGAVEEGLEEGMEPLAAWLESRDGAGAGADRVAGGAGIPCELDGH